MPRKNGSLCIFLAPLRILILTLNSYKASDFDLKVLPRLRYCQKVFAHFQKMDLNNFKWADSEKISRLKFYALKRFVPGKKMFLFVLFHMTWFWTRIFATLSVANYILYNFRNQSKVEIYRKKIIGRVKLWKEVCFKKTQLEWINFLQNFEIFCNFCTFAKGMILV